MIRQFLTSLVILVAAGLAWLFLVPNAPATLASYGIVLPFGPQAAAVAEGTGQRGTGGPSGPGGQGGTGGRPGGFAGRATNVVTTPVVMATINDTLNAIGEGTPVRSVTVVAPSAGTLAEVLARPGDRVDAGAVIARFDSQSEQIDYDRAVLAAEDARATLERTSGLASSNVVAGTTLAAAELAAANAELEVRNAELALERRSITSPIAGTVGLIRVTPGNYVGAQTAVTTIDDTASILIDFWVPERYSGQLEPGMEVSVNAVALPGQTFTGDISAVDSRIDPASRTLQVQAEIPNDDGLLRAGMSYSVALDFPGETYPAVNPLAVLWSAEGSYIWKLSEGVAARVPAEIVQRNSDGVLVRADLTTEDAVITEGILQLSEGTQITVLEGPGAGDSAAPARTAGS